MMSGSQASGLTGSSGVTDSSGRLDVQVLLTPQLFGLLAQATATAARVSALLAPHPPTGVDVRIEPHVDDSERACMVRISVTGREWPLPRSTLLTALAYAIGNAEVLWDPDVPAVVERLEAAEGGPERAVGEWLALVCGVVLTGYADGPGRAWPGDEEFGPALEVVEVRVEPAYLRTLTIAGLDYDPLTFARNGLFYELGVPIPPFQFCRDPDLRAGAFSVRLPGLTVLPRIGLPAGTIMVNDTVERLALVDVSATATTNPATDQPAAIVSAEHNEVLTAMGLTTWDPMGYLVLCLADAVRSGAHRFVTAQAVEGVLAQIAQVWPFLVDVVNDRFERGEVAAVLRALAREQVSSLNLRRILALLLRAADEDVPSVQRLTHVRAGLAGQIAAKVSRGTSTIVVYLLDPELERGVVGPEGERFARELRASVDAELMTLPSTAQAPAILTQDAARLAVYVALAPGLPRVQVLGWSDVPAAFNVQPVARISAPGASFG